MLGDAGAMCCPAPDCLLCDPPYQNVLMTPVPGNSLKWVAIIVGSPFCPVHIFFSYALHSIHSPILPLPQLFKHCLSFYRRLSSYILTLTPSKMCGCFCATWVRTFFTDGDRLVNSLPSGVFTLDCDVHLVLSLMISVHEEMLKITT